MSCSIKIKLYYYQGLIKKDKEGMVVEINIATFSFNNVCFTTLSKYYAPSLDTKQ